MLHISAKELELGDAKAAIAKYRPGSAAVFGAHVRKVSSPSRHGSKDVQFCGFFA